MKNDDIRFLRLWDLYSPLLTKTQREITDLYFNYDLSLGEIAEQKGVSRQSVSDCLGKCRKQLEEYDEKLGFSKALDEDGEYIYTLGSDKYFCMGDNRNNSTDSRYFGAVDAKDIQGKVVIHVKHGESLFTVIWKRIFG